MTNTDCKYYYSIDGVNVFLALECEMKGVEPYETGNSDKNAYELKDYPIFIEQNGEDAEPGMTYYEAYNGRYAEPGSEISWRTVVNEENSQATVEDWVLVSDNDDADHALIDNGFEPWKYSDNSYPCQDIVDKEKEEEPDLKVVDVTEGMNGYPSHVREAIVGFSSFEVAQLLAKKYQKDVVLLHKRDGWNLWEVSDSCLLNEPTLSPEDLGYYMVWDRNTSEEEVVSELKETIDGLEELSTIATCAQEFAKMYAAIENLLPGEALFYNSTAGNPFAWEVSQVHPMNWSYDTHNYIVGIM